MTRYAEGTTVQPETSQQEISGLLRRYGADGFAYGWESDRALVSFRAHGGETRIQQGSELRHSASHGRSSSRT